MTYFQFHLVFLFPALLLLAVLKPRPLAVDTRQRLGGLLLLALIALIYTTPWDNYLVYRDVWWYGPERVLAVIGYVPIEEYMFFVLQPLLTGLWLYRVLDRLPTPPTPSPGYRPNIIGGLVGMAFALWGYFLMQHDAGLYMGLILVWASPVIAGQLAYGGNTMWAYRKAWMVSVFVPTFYLWIADRIAINVGIWDISKQFTLGPTLFGLPIEEAVFFLVTNILVVQGLMLFRLVGLKWRQPKSTPG